MRDRRADAGAQVPVGQGQALVEREPEMGGTGAPLHSTAARWMIRAGTLRMHLDPETEVALSDLVGRLDSLVPTEGAHLTIPADPEGRTSAGNRLGYLRFGIEFLLAALYPVPASRDEAAQVVPQLGGLLSPGSRAPFETCELDESIGSRPPIASGLGGIGQIAVASGAVLLLILAFVGAAVVWRFAFR